MLMPVRWTPTCARGFLGDNRFLLIMILAELEWAYSIKPRKPYTPTSLDEHIDSCILSPCIYVSGFDFGTTRGYGSEQASGIIQRTCSFNAQESESYSVGVISSVEIKGSFFEIMTTRTGVSVSPKTTHSKASLTLSVSTALGSAASSNTSISTTALSAMSSRSDVRLCSVFLSMLNTMFLAALDALSRPSE